jgi:hypothetical protein
MVSILTNYFSCMWLIFHIINCFLFSVFYQIVPHLLYVSLVWHKLSYSTLVNPCLLNITSNHVVLVSLESCMQKIRHLNLSQTTSNPDIFYGLPRSLLISKKGGLNHINTLYWEEQFHQKQ